MTLALQPLFKRSVTFTERDDDDLAEQVAKFGYQHEFADISWFPGHGRAVYRIDDRLPLTAPGDGAMDFIGFRATLTLVIQANRLAEDLFERAGNGSGKCLTSRVTHAALSVAGYGLQRRRGGLFTGYPVVGPQHRMQASGGCVTGPEDALLTACPWDPRVRGGTFFHQTTFSLPLRRAAAFIAEVQRLRDLEPRALCGVELYDGILMRYVKASTAHLGKPTPRGEPSGDMVDFDITYYRSRDPGRAGGDRADGHLQVRRPASMGQEPQPRLRRRCAQVPGLAAVPARQGHLRPRRPLLRRLERHDARHRREVADDGRARVRAQRDVRVLARRALRAGAGLRLTLRQGVQGRQSLHQSVVVE